MKENYIFCAAVDVGVRDSEPHNIFYVLFCACACFFNFSFPSPTTTIICCAQLPNKIVISNKMATDFNVLSSFMRNNK